MKKHRDGPFFLGVGFFRPHTPYVAPKHWFDLHPLESMRLPYAPDDDRTDLRRRPSPTTIGYGLRSLDEETLRRALQPTTRAFPLSMPRSAAPRGAR